MKSRILFSFFSFVVLPALASADSLILSFDAKGTAMGWDVGVAKALAERLKPGKITNYAFVGSSSGSLLATYFACHGLSENSVNYLIAKSKDFPKDGLDESSNKRTVQILLGVPSEISLDVAKPLLELATKNETCLPEHPLLIVTGNFDIVNRRRTDRAFAGKTGATLNLKTYDVSESGKVLGKACTYFVNEPMEKILSAVPAKERLCDLRKIRTAKDVSVAVKASASEPSYFEPFVEPDPTQIESIHGPVAKRVYNGGFVMMNPIPDIKRALPKAWALGTGRAFHGRFQNRAIQNWTTVPMNETQLMHRWYFDAQLQQSKDAWEALYDKKITAAEQIRRGYEAEKACLDAEGCAPKLTLTPAFTTDGKGADLTPLRHRSLKPLLE